MTLEKFNSPGIHVVSHGKLKGYHGAWIFQHKQTIIISLPVVLPDVVERAQQIKTAEVISVNTAKLLFDSSTVEKMIGPAYQGYLNRSIFRPGQNGRVRRMTARNEVEFGRFLENCLTEELEESSVGIDDQDVFAFFSDEQILAVANVRKVDDASLLGVICHPQFRGKGYGKAVITAAAEDALLKNYPVRYQALCSNKGSLGLAASIGVRECGKNIAVRFKK